MEKEKPNFFYSHEVKRKRKTFKNHQKNVGRNPFDNLDTKRKHSIVGVKPKKPIRPSRTTRRAVDKVTEESIRKRNVLIKQKKRGGKRKRGNSNFRQRFNLNDTTKTFANKNHDQTHLGDPDEDFLKRIGFNKGGRPYQPPNKRRKLNDDPRSEKKKIFADVIRNSKIKRHKRKQNKIMLEETIEELDQTFAEIRKLDKKAESKSKIFSKNSNESISEITVPPPPSDDLSSLIESLQSSGTKLIRPSPKIDTMRTIEEQTRFLQQKEEERIQRMSKATQRTEQVKMISGDALDDDYLHYVKDDEELGIEIEDLELDYDSLENKNRMKLQEGVYEEPVIEDKKEKKKKKKRKKKKKKTRGEPTNIDHYLPLIANSSSLFDEEEEDEDKHDDEEENEEENSMSFIPELPTTFKNLKDITKKNRPSKIHTLLLRIETVHCARLSQQHHSKMSKFYSLLFRFFLQCVQKSTKSSILRDMKVLDVLSYHIHVLSFQVPRVASSLFVKKIERMKNLYLSSSNSRPSWEDLFFLSLVKKVYPVSDFSHFVVTPLLRICSIMLGRIEEEKVKLSEYFLLTKLILSFMSSKSRYMPSLNNYFILSFKRILAGEGRREVEGIDEDVNDLDFIFGNEELYARLWRKKVLYLFSEYVDVCSKLPSFPEIFGRYEEVIKRICSSQADPNTANFEKSVLSKIERTKKSIWETRSFLTLSVPYRPPEIGIVSPSYQLGGYRGKVIRDRVQKSALLRRKIKKAIRGVRKEAVKHIQKTESVGNLVKERERKRKERDMKSKYKRVVTLLQQDRQKSMTSHVKDKDIERIRERKKKIRERRK